MSLFFPLFTCNVMHDCKHAVVDKRRVLLIILQQSSKLSHHLCVGELLDVLGPVKLGTLQHYNDAVRLLSSKLVSAHAHLQLLQLGHKLQVGEQHVVGDDKVRQILQRLKLGVEPSEQEHQQLST